MAKQVTFKVSKTGKAPVVVTFLEPESVDDPRWEELGVSREAINNLAVDSLIIKAQAVGRAVLDEGPEAVQKAVDNYKYGQRSAGGRRVVELKAEQIKEAKFNEKQLEMLRAAGIKIEDLASA